MFKVASELESLVSALAELKRGKESCDYDWDYFCHREIEAVERAEKEFLDAVRRVLQEDAAQ